MEEEILNAKKQGRLKGVSKFIYIVAKIGQVLVILGAICLLVGVIVVPNVIKNIKYEDNILEIFNQKFEYKKEFDKVIIKNGENNIELTSQDEIMVFDMVINALENTDFSKLTITIEIVLVVFIITMVLLSIVLKHLNKLFRNICYEDTPFILENVNLLKKICYFLIAVYVLPIFGNVIISLTTKSDFTINVNFVNLMFILIVYSAMYIFEYGCSLQKGSKKKIYEVTHE